MIQLRPSSSGRWTRCAASASFEADQPEEPPTDEAREGTAAAWVADCVLRGDAHDASDMTGETHANGHLVTPDMVFHVQKYIDLVRSFGGQVASESFGRLNEFIAGTLDSSIVTFGGYMLRVKDLKYGYDIVEPFQNTQLLIYAGIELMRLGHPAQITHVELSIFQPRAYHPEGINRTWTITVPELWGWINWIVERGNDCQKPQPVATPGAHCVHCRALASCVAVSHTVYRAFTVLQDVRQKKLSAQELSLEYTFLTLAEKLVKARKSAISTETETRMMTGENIPGWQLRDNFGHRKFTVPPAVVKGLTGIDPTKKVEMTPAELEREGINPDIVNTIAKAPFIGKKLVPVTSRDFAKVFGEKK